RLGRDRPGPGERHPEAAADRRRDERHLEQRERLADALAPADAGLAFDVKHISLALASLHGTHVGPRHPPAVARGGTPARDRRGGDRDTWFATRRTDRPRRR